MVGWSSGQNMRGDINYTIIQTQNKEKERGEGEGEKITLILLS